MLPRVVAHIRYVYICCVGIGRDRNYTSVIPLFVTFCEHFWPICLRQENVTFLSRTGNGYVTGEYTVTCTVTAKPLM